MLLAQQRWLRRRARADCVRAFAAAAAAADAPDGAAGAARCVATPPVEAAVPFELNPAAARAKFNAWCSQRLLAPSSLWDESNRECRAVAAQLPFWAFDAVADVRYRGLVGFKTGSKGGVRWQAVLDWRQHAGQTLHRTEAFAQVYASFDLRRDHVATAVCGHHASRAVPSAAAAGGGGDALPPYEMGRGLAWALARRHIEGELRARATQALRASAGADDVRDLECEITFRSVKAHALRLPAYVVRFTHGTILAEDQSITPERFSAVIGGVTGAVGAERLFSPPKARAAAAAPAAALAVLGQLMAATPQAATAIGFECAFLGAIAAVLAGVAAKRLPYNWHATAEGARQRQIDGAFEALRATSGANEWTDEKLQRARDAAEWQRWEETGLWRWDARGRAEWARALLRGQAERARERRRWRAMRQADAERAEEAERRSAAKQARWGDDWARGTPAAPTGPQDPLGYYKLLGLTDKVGVATEEEIKAAFRREAQRLHPDKHAAGSAAASADAFRKLQAAYVVLRDPRQRKLYSQHPDA